MRCTLRPSRSSRLRSATRRRTVSQDQPSLAVVVSSTAADRLTSLRSLPSGVGRKMYTDYEIVCMVRCWYSSSQSSWGGEQLTSCLFHRSSSFAQLHAPTLWPLSCLLGRSRSHCRLVRKSRHFTFPDQYSGLQAPPFGCPPSVLGL